MCVCVCALSHSVMSNSATPWTVACHSPLSMGFSRQEYRSGLSFPPPGDLPNPGLKPGSPALAGRFFTVWVTREALPGKGTIGEVQILYPDSIASVSQGHVQQASWPWPMTLTFLNGGLGWRPRRGCHVPREAGKDLSFPNLSRRSTTSKDGQNCICPFFPGGISCF